MPVATARRLCDELNISAELEFVYHFTYQADFGDAGSENEFCHVFLGKAGGTIQPNDSEIESVRFISIANLDIEIDEFPQRFTPWFKQEWRALRETYKEQLARYAI